MIGILAGMGPRSTSPFLEKVLDECVRQYGARHDDDFPPMMIHSLPTPFRLDGPPDHDAMRRTIRDGLERLAATRAAVLAVPCNVAHLYWDDVVAGVDAPVLHLVRIAAGAVPADAGPVAVLATRATAEAGLYDDALRARGIEPVDAAPFREAVDGIIGGVKASWPAARLDAHWHALVDALRADGVGCAVLGSTDLGAVPAVRAEERVVVVDGSAALARELVERWRAL